MASGRFNNLVTATMPGTNVLMPGGIGGLGATMPGDSFTPNSIASGGLYAKPVGVGDGSSGPANPPLAGMQSDSEDYVSIDVRVATTNGQNHTRYLYAHAPAFIFREDPMNNSTAQKVTHKLVTLPWLNIFASQLYASGLRNINDFIKNFMYSNQSQFPTVFKETLSGKGPNGQRGNHTADPYGAPMGALGLWGDEDDGDVPDDMLDEDPMSVLDQTEDHFNELKTAFTKYLALNMPPDDYLFTQATESNSNYCGPCWFSNIYDMPRNHTSEISEYVAQVKQKNRTVVHNNAPEARTVYIDELQDSLTTHTALQRSEKDYARGKSGKSRDQAHQQHFHGDNGVDILLKSDLEKFLNFKEAVKNKESSMIDEVIAEFRAIINLPKTTQFNAVPSGLDYLLKGGIESNWKFLGVVNTVTSNNAQERSYGKPFIGQPMAKVVVEREDLCYNVWGHNLPQGTKLYFLIRRRNIRQSINRLLARLIERDLPNNDEYSDNSTQYGLETLSLQGDMTPLKLAKLAWQAYGAYEIVPYSNGRHGITSRDDMAYVNCFGRIEYPTIIPVGVAKHDNYFYDYSYSCRNTALGIPNADTGAPPLLESTQRAMISLPTITVLFGLFSC